MSDYYTREQVLNTLVTAFGDRDRALDVDHAFQTGDPVAHYVDAFLVEAQNNGLLDAEDYFGSESWVEAVDAVYPEDDEA